MSVSDAGYPMFIVSVRFPDGRDDRTFLLNNEAADLGGVPPGDYEGSLAELRYTSAVEPSLIDIQVDGRSALDIDRPVSTSPDDLSVTGVLSGAEEVTQSDLPDQITVTPATGGPVTFDYFIPPELVELNGKTVTAIYAEETVDRITWMRGGNGHPPR
ncbi:hypothetical protein GC169_07200 [bacterium]|nr:hypothetical protein [bacterium]